MTAAVLDRSEPIEQDHQEVPPTRGPGRGRAILSMIAWLYLTVFVCLSMWIVATLVVFGWTPNLTTSGSMEPSVRPGDIVLTSEVGDEPMGIGSVIVFEGPNGNVIHRVTAIDEEDEDDLSYRTRGDANADEDPMPVRQDQIVGAGRLLIPMIGLPAHWFKSGNTVGFAGWVMATIAALALAPNPNRRRRS